jgi:threonine/homoserine/homoserine lactone efflux protein
MIPVEAATLGAFALAAAVIVVSPGPDTALILRNAIGQGRRAGAATVLGVQIGLVGHTIAAVAGLSLLIAAVPAALDAIALAGAAYLAWLGIASLRADPIPVGGSGGTGRLIACGRDAAMTNLLNPKVILLYLALMPGFVDPARGPVAPQLVTLAATLIVINVAWQLPLALAAGAMREPLLRPSVQRAVLRATGIVLLGFAVLLVVERLR